MTAVRYIIRYPLAFAFLVAALTSCVYESNSACVQYVIKPYLTDSSGVERSDTAVKSVRAYLFIGGKFTREIREGSDGRFAVGLDGREGAVLSVFGYPNNDSLSLPAPKSGEAVSSAATELSPSSGDYSPCGFYYGVFGYSPSSQDKEVNKEIKVALHPGRATVHIVVENLHAMYGAGGDYLIEVSGLNNSVSFEGDVCGDTLEYTPKASFDNKDNLCSEAVHTLPTKTGNSLRVTILRDGKLIWQSTKDNEGNSVTLSGGDDKALLVNVELRDVGFQIMRWSDYEVSTIIN